jgi:hypothetical protein
MMDRFTREDLSRLAEANLDPALSLYMPAFRSGRDVAQNAIRFRNLMKAAAEELARYGSDKGLQQRLAEARQRERDDVWWQQQSDGLAIFIAADRCQMYRLPLNFKEQVVVGPRFHVKPLVPLLQGDGRFFILAVSQNDVRLLEGSRYSVAELEHAGLPADLRSALNIDEYVSSMQHHASGLALGAPGSTLFHGHGGGGMDVRKEDEIQQFFHRLDTALTAFLRDERVPLVFAGVEYLFPLFRRTCKYAGLIDTPVTGNPDGLIAAELHEKAWSVVEPVFQEQSRAALRRYERLAGTNEVAHELPQILTAARQGQVDTLLIAAGAQVNGVFDAAGGAIHPDARAGDLLNEAAVQTLANSGEVLSLEPEQMPAKGPVVAILRYPLLREQATRASQASHSQTTRGAARA